MTSVAEQVVVVTGGASGLGLATARALSGRGARLALVDIDAAGVERPLPRSGVAPSGLQPTSPTPRR